MGLTCAGETPTRPADPDATRLMAAVRDDDRATIDDLLNKNPRAATLRGPSGSTPGTAQVSVSLLKTRCAPVSRCAI